MNQPISHSAEWRWRELDATARYLFLRRVGEASFSDTYANRSGLSIDPTFLSCFLWVSRTTISHVISSACKYSSSQRRDTYYRIFRFPAAFGTFRQQLVVALLVHRRLTRCNKQENPPVSSFTLMSAKRENKNTHDRNNWGFTLALISLFSETPRKHKNRRLRNVSSRFGIAEISEGWRINN